MAKTKVHGEFLKDSVVRFTAKAGENITKGQAVYISGVSGEKPVVSLADANDTAKMPAFGLAEATVSTNAEVEITSFGTLGGLDTSSYSLGDILYVDTTAGALTNNPSGLEATKLQNIGMVQRVHASSGSIKVGGAGRTNAVPNLDDGDIFIGDSNNKAISSPLSTEIESYLDGGTSTPILTSLTVASDTDVTVDIGRAKIGNVGFSDFAGFAHRDNATTTNYALLQYNTGETYLNAASGRDINFRINNSNVGVFKSSGSFGIGNSSPTRNLTVGDTAASSAINIKSSATNGYSILALGDSGDDNYAQIFLDNGTNKLQIQNGGGGAIGNRGITLDSSENVGIGTSSPANPLHVSASTTDVAKFETTGAYTFVSLDNATRDWALSVGSSFGIYDKTAAATRLSIDSSGHLDLDGYIDNTRNNTSISPPSNSDHTLGTRIKFYDAGEAVWYAMGIENNHLWFNADPGFKFYSDSVLSATIDDDGIKFNGDTAAANALDDYEEGTWTPTLTGGTPSYSVRSGRYTKIGNIVQLRFAIKLSGWTSGSGAVTITGQPFTSPVAAYDHDFAAFFMSHKPNDFVWVAGMDSNAIFFRRADVANADTGMVGSNVDSDTSFIGTFVYRTS